MIATGAAMSPAIGAQFPWYPKIFRGRQVARSLHFLGMVGFVLFIVIHISMVMITGFPENMGNIFLGKATSLGIDYWNICAICSSCCGHSGLGYRCFT